jgi:hypothetical protein
MKEDLFAELLESVREGGAILRGEYQNVTKLGTRAAYTAGGGASIAASGRQASRRRMGCRSARI